MKLRAKIIDREMIIYLMKVLASMAKMAKNLVFKFTETHVTILADAKHIVDGQLTIWAQLTVNQYFQEYKFNGVCTEYHESLDMYSYKLAPKTHDDGMM